LPKQEVAKIGSSQNGKEISNNKLSNTKINNNIINNNICEFEDFWSLYKRKIDKGRAEKAFNRLDTEEKILAIEGAKKWARYWEADKTEMQYIPHPTTWLNNKRWQVEPPAIQTKNKKAPANAYQEQPESFLDGFTI
jgi:hypothetical protein